MGKPPSAPLPVPAAGALLTAARVEWIDVVRGVAIALVVYGHVMQGGAASGSIPDGPFFHFSNAFVYSFHMPAFFFISGFLSARSLRGPPGKYLRDKVTTIAWPYFVWTFLGLASSVLFARFYHHHSSESPVHRALTFIWDPGEFWFLHTLFCVQVAMMAAIWVRIEIVVVLALAGFFLSGWSHVPVIDKFLFFLPFFAVGIWCYPRLNDFLERFRGAAPAIVAGALLFVFQAAVVASVAGQWAVALLVLGFTGTLGLIALARATGGTYFAKTWARIGAASLGVFLLHPFIQGAVRTLLQRAFHLQNGISVAIQIVAAVLLPVFIYEFLMRTPGRCLFTLKASRKAPVSRGAI